MSLIFGFSHAHEFNFKILDVWWQNWQQASWLNFYLSVLTYSLSWDALNTNKCVIGLYVGVTCCIHKLIGILIVILTHSSTYWISHIPAFVRQWHVPSECLLDYSPLVLCIISYCCNLRKYPTNVLSKVLWVQKSPSVLERATHRSPASPFKYGWASLQGSVSPRTRLWMEVPRAIMEKCIWGEV